MSSWDIDALLVMMFEIASDNWLICAGETMKRDASLVLTILLKCTLNNKSLFITKVLVSSITFFWVLFLPAVGFCYCKGKCSKSFHIALFLC